MSSSHGNPGTESAEAELQDPKYQLPAVMARNEEAVREGFWKKMTRVAGKIPFAEEAAAAWYCARDPATPMRVKATLLAALAYFVLPTDIIPDFIAAFGFTDDATVLMAAVGLVSSHMKPQHRKAAREALGLPPAEKKN
ncbi:MAG: YkvA family protein [Parvibaculum sp.]